MEGVTFRCMEKGLKKATLTPLGLYPSIQEEMYSIKHVKSLARNTQVFQFLRVAMVTLLKRRLKYGTLNARRPKGLKH